ncbi:MAG: hypothetical protein AAF402_07615 [Pseudomonadota bacterium]
MAIHLQQQHLIFTHDQFVLRGALAKRGGGELIARASSTNLDLDAALEEVLSDLRGQVKRLPKKAVLAASYAVTGLFQLPVNPKRPRPDHQMQELVRYELEGALGEFNDLWTISAVTQGRGYIDFDQRQITSDELENRRASGSSGLVRFGDVAMELGYISASQRDEIMDLQAELTSSEEMLFCGWQPQVYQIKDETPVELWYGAGIDQLKRRAWAKRFREEGIKLTHIYPLSDLGLYSAAANIVEEQSALLIRVEAEQAQSWRIEKDPWNRAQLTATATDRLSGARDLDNLIDLCLDQLNDKIERIYLLLDTVFHPHQDQILDLISSRLDKPVEQLVRGQSDIAGLQLLSIASNNIGKDHFLVSIAGQDPGPPLWRNTRVLRYGIPATVILGMVGLEAYTRVNTHQLEKELITLKSDTSKTSKINTELAVVQNQADQIQDRIIVLENELEDLKSSIASADLFQDRSTLAYDILSVLLESVTSEVILESFDEPARSKNPGFHLKAWATTDSAAVRFIGKLGRNLRDVSYRVINANRQAENNRFGMNGFGIDLWVVPDTREVETLVEN